MTELKVRRLKQRLRSRLRDGFVLGTFFLPVRWFLSGIYNFSLKRLTRALAGLLYVQKLVARVLWQQATGWSAPRTSI